MIDIVTTTWKSYDKFDRCLNSVLSKTEGVDYKWYIWCNEAGDKTKQIIESKNTDRIIPIYNDNNLGSFSSNNNAAAAKGNGEYILFLNDDTVALDSAWLAAMKSILDNDSKVGIVGALLMYPDLKTIQHCGVFFSHQTNNMPYHMFYKRRLAEVENFVMKSRYYQVVTGACLLIRRECFERVGGFSTDFFYSFDDVNLCLQVKSKTKQTCVYTPKAKLIHDEGISGTQPRLKDNIAAFRKNCVGLYYNDLEFYQKDKNFMLYKRLGYS